MGVALALADRGLSVIAPPLPRSALTIALSVLLSGGLHASGVARTVSALIRGRSADVPAIAWPGVAVALLMLVAEVFALGALISPPARARALVLAMLLSRWAMVPIGYGLRPLEESGLGIPYFGGITFSEFGISSVIALGAAMGLYDVVGLAAHYSGGADDPGPSAVVQPPPGRRGRSCARCRRRSLRIGDRRRAGGDISHLTRIGRTAEAGLMASGFCHYSKAPGS